jgi:hypothetical protein
MDHATADRAANAANIKATSSVLIKEINEWVARM